MKILIKCPECHGLGFIIIGLNVLRCKRCHGNRFISEEIGMIEFFSAAQKSFKKWKGEE